MYNDDEIISLLEKNFHESMQLIYESRNKKTRNSNINNGITFLSKFYYYFFRTIRKDDEESIKLFKKMNAVMNRMTREYLLASLNLYKKINKSYLDILLTVLNNNFFLFINTKNIEDNLLEYHRIVPCEYNSPEYYLEFYKVGNKIPTDGYIVLGIFQELVQDVSFWEEIYTKLVTSDIKNNALYMQNIYMLMGFLVNNHLFINIDEKRNEIVDHIINLFKNDFPDDYKIMGGLSYNKLNSIFIILLKKRNEMGDIRIYNENRIIFEHKFFDGKRPIKPQISDTKKDLRNFDFDSVSFSIYSSVYMYTTSESIMDIYAILSSNIVDGSDMMYKEMKLKDNLSIFDKRVMTYLISEDIIDWKMFDDYILEKLYDIIKDKKSNHLHQFELYYHINTKKYFEQNKKIIEDTLLKYAIFIVKKLFADNKPSYIINNFISDYGFINIIGDRFNEWLLEEGENIKDKESRNIIQQIMIEHQLFDENDEE